MIEYYVVGKSSRATWVDVEVGDILHRSSGKSAMRDLSGAHVTEHGSPGWKRLNAKPLLESVDKLVFFNPVYKGKDIRVIMAYDGGHSYTIRTDKNGTKVFKVAVKGNKKNQSRVVAANKSKLKRKNYMRKKGFFSSREDAIKNEGKITTCTLLRKWDDLEGKVKYPLIGSPKIDGIRCTYRGKRLKSRGDKTIHAPHILGGLLESELDGELYIPGASLETIQSIVTKVSHGYKSDLHYFIFDMPVAKPFIERLADMEMLKTFYKHEPNIHFIPQKVINNREEADEFYEWCLHKGYEGAVYRTVKGIYCDGRTPEIIKRKALITEEFEILEVLKDKDGLVYFKLQCEAGTFKSVPKWTDEERRRNYVTFLDNYVAEVQYYDKTERGIPKFSNVTVLRKVEGGKLQF